MMSKWWIIIGVVLFALNLAFVGVNIGRESYGLAGFNFAAAILVFYTCIYMPIRH